MNGSLPCLPRPLPVRGLSFSVADRAERHRVAACLALLCGLLFSGWAQPGRAAPTAERMVLSFEQAVSLSLSRSLSLRSAQLEIDRAQALLMQARAASLPTLNLSLNYTRLDNDRVLGSGDMQRLVAGANQTSGNLTVSVPIVAPARWASWLHAQDSRRVAEISLNEVRRQVAIAVARACLSVIAQSRLVDVSERAEKTALAHFEYASQRLGGGVGNRLDAVRAESELQLTRSQLALSQAALQRSREALGVLLAADQPVDCRDAPSLTAADALSDELRQAEDGSRGALDELALLRSDLRLWQARAWASARLIRHGWTDFLPQLSVSFAPFFQDPPSIVQPQLGWQARFDFSWALFDGGLRYGLRAERWVQYRQVKTSQQLAELQARSDVRSALATLRSAGVSQSAALRASQSSEEASTLSMRAYRAGISNNLSVIDAERRARDAATAATQAEDALRQARLELLIASGRFPPNLSPPG
jgi:outer membrane protein TolC